MEELFTGGEYYGAGRTEDMVAGVKTPSFWVGMLVGLVVALIVCFILWWTKAGVFKGRFTQREGLYAGIRSMRDDTGFPSVDSLAEAARKREQLIESGREPNLYNADPIDLGTQLAIRTQLASKDQENTETAALAAAMQANAAAGKAKYTERMSPEDEIRKQQKASAGLSVAGL